MHLRNLRIAYRKSDQFEKLGYERQFFRFLQRVDDDMKRKIERNKERLALTQGAQVQSKILNVKLFKFNLAHG